MRISCDQAPQAEYRLARFAVGLGRPPGWGERCGHRRIVEGVAAQDAGWKVGLLQPERGEAGLHRCASGDQSGQGDPTALAVDDRVETKQHSSALRESGL